MAVVIRRNWDVVSDNQIDPGAIPNGEGQVKISSNDTTFDFIDTKLVAGANVTLTENNDGANETLTIASTASGGSTIITEDEGIQIDAAATTLDFVGAGVTATDAGSNVTTITIPGGSSPLTTKGDLYTYDTGDARLAVGTNGQVLSANSATATGLEWIAAGGGGSDYLAENYSGTLPVVSGTLAGAFGEGSQATGTFSLALGRLALALDTSATAVGNQADADDSNATAIGANSDINNSSPSGTALGVSATVTNSASGLALGASATVSGAANAVQIGTGTNSTATTLQYRAITICNAVGVQIAYQTTGSTPVTAPANGTLVLDNNGGTTTLYGRANGAWVTLVTV